MSNGDKKLVYLVQQISRRGAVILAGKEEKDDFGRKLIPDSRFFDSVKGTYSTEVKKILKALKENKDDIASVLNEEVMFYDIRSSVWRDHPELSVLMALTYASILIDRSGEKDGHIINLNVDCYQKHFEAISIMADTLLRTGITENGGGLIYWGVQNHGNMRNISQYLSANCKEAGNWISATMSHRREDFIGAKFGMLGQAFCGNELKEVFIEKLISGKYPGMGLKSDSIITVGDTYENELDIAEDLIRSRTGTKVKLREFLKGLKLEINTCGSPILIKLVRQLRDMGANVEAGIESANPEFNPEFLIDPNEKQSLAIKEIKEKALTSSRIHLVFDQAGGRSTIITKKSNEEIVAMQGSEVLLLALENLATYNPHKEQVKVIYDIRTGINISAFQKKLSEKGFKIKVVPSEPGYPYVLERMNESDYVVFAVENTGHYYLNPYSKKVWGAIKEDSGVQAGDDSALFMIYLLSLSSLLWDKKTPAEQLESIRKKYQLPETIIREYRPTVYKKDSDKREEVLKTLKNILTRRLNKRIGYHLEEFNQGIRLLNDESRIFIRCSNTGPAMTLSFEATSEEAAVKILELTGAFFTLALTDVAQRLGDFRFDWGDFPYGDMTLEEATEAISSKFNL